MAATGPRRVVTRDEVAGAVAALDLAALGEARWFAAKGHRVTAASLDEAFVLDGGHHVLAIATLTLDDRSRQRYSPATDRRAAAPGRSG